MRLLLLTCACLTCAICVAYVTGAVGASSTASPVIQACENNATGLLRIVSNNQTQCLKRLETPLSWSQQGVPGVAGAQGHTGSAGPQGPAGTNGKPGTSNITGVQQIAVGDAPCSNGGWRFLTTLGSYTVCNGVDGKTAAGGPPANP